MTRTLFLHLGMNKAGSTSIQRSFEGYEDGRLCYLDAGPDNHFHLLLNRWRRMTGQPMQAVRVRDYPDDPAQLQDKFDKALRDETRSLIISGEALASSRFPDEALDLLLSEFRNHFDDIRAVAYLREPVSYIRSAMQQRLKRHPGLFKPARFYPGYEGKFGRWIDALGEDKVVLVPFDRTAFRNGDLLDDFAARVGASGPAHRFDQANPSFSAESFSLIWALYRSLGNQWQTDGGRKRISRAITSLRSQAGTAFEIDPEACRAVMSERGADIAWAEARMGRALPDYRPVEGAVVFRSEDEILAYAKAQAVDLDTLGLTAPPDETPRAKRAMRRIAAIFGLR